MLRSGWSYDGRAWFWLAALCLVIGVPVALVHGDVMAAGYQMLWVVLATTMGFVKRRQVHRR